MKRSSLFKLAIPLCLKEPYNLAQIVSGLQTKKLADFHTDPSDTSLQGGVVQYHLEKAQYCYDGMKQCIRYGFETAQKPQPLQKDDRNRSLGPTSVYMDSFYIIGGEADQVSVLRFQDGQFFVSHRQYDLSGDEDGSYGCAARMDQLSFLFIRGKIATVYYFFFQGLNSKSYTMELNYSRVKAGCDVFTDVEGNESVIIAGGDPAEDVDAAATSEILDRKDQVAFKIFFYCV